MLKTAGTSLVLLTSVAGFCQTTPSRPAFEVASVRAGTSGRIFSPDMLPTTVSAADSLMMRNMTLRGAVAWAYHVMDYQVTGPEWIQLQRYNISAKSGGPVHEDELRTMLQTLLADRFKVAFHRETKEQQVFVLSVGKNGTKLKETESEGDLSIQPDQKRMTITVNRAPISRLVEGLSEVFKAPVIDKTGLNAKYDITVDVGKYMADFQSSAGGTPPDPIAMITMGLQDALGLKLESKKVALDLLVIDRAEKVPTEN